MSAIHSELLEENKECGKYPLNTSFILKTRSIGLFSSNNHEYASIPIHIPESANCGRRGDLLTCSRCRNAQFCSAKCQRSYWPFHREWCRRNEFADAIEDKVDKFSSLCKRRIERVEELESREYNKFRRSHSSRNG